MLAYDLTTGALITSFAPTFNAQVRSITVTPDGTKVYVGGEFTQVNGATRNRVAAFDPPTGALLAVQRRTSTRASRSSRRRTATLYIGGIFSTDQQRGAAPASPR